MKLKNILWGLFFIIAGSAIVMNHFFEFTDISMISLIITILLIPLIIMSLMHKQFGGVFFPIAILGIIYDKPLGIEELTPWPLIIVAVLLTIGFSIIFHKHNQFVQIGVLNNIDDEDVIINEDDGSVVNVTVKFGSSIKYVNSDNLKYGNFNCSFGALKVYFDNTTLDENGAKINLNASFAGVELFIPKNWEVVHGTNATIGGIETKNRNVPDGKNKIIITGNVSFAGVEITYI